MNTLLIIIIYLAAAIALFSIGFDCGRRDRNK